MPYFIPQRLNENNHTPAGGVCTLEYINGYTCPDGYDLINNVCVLRSDPTETVKLDHSIGYDFEYYENGGELVGKYKYESAQESSCVFPVFCDQNVLIKNIGDISIENKTMAINNDESAIRFDFSYSNVSKSISVTNWANAEQDNVFYHGQFYLLPNHPLSIKKINFHYDIINNNKSYPSCDDVVGSFSPIPYDRYTLNPNSFVELYIGIAAIPFFDKPSNFNGTVTPTLENPVSGTQDILNWNQLSDSCFRWYRIYDKADLNYQDPNELVSSIGEKLSLLRPSQYVINFKTVINKEKLETFIKANFNDVNLDLSLLFYPISTYLYPADMITSVEYPVTNSVNPHIDYVIFKLPNNYKTEGNMQFKIDFLKSSYGDIIFTSSSYGFNTDASDSETISPNSLVTKQNYEQYHWFVSTNKVQWRNIQNNIPLFKNEFIESAGPDSEFDIYVKYQLSEAAKAVVLQQQTVLFKISQLDGTLTEL